jgi:tetratricopeptide (TPR) repeat protein
LAVSYIESVCRLTLCLADALQYAHERGLVHLDLKPSNVLIAADGQPMVLDFHLAREPIVTHDAAPPRFGGTPGYMSPEQEAVFAAARQGRPAPQPVDERSDIYSLGAVLYEALGGVRQNGLPQPLTRLNSQVSAGLSDIVDKCLAAEPANRYPHMAALAADLRRHLAHLPLRGVRNRSIAERWHKWRRRRPHGVALIAMMLLMLTATATVAVGVARHIVDRLDQADAALAQAQMQMSRHDWPAATSTLRRGLAAVRDLPGEWAVTSELESRLKRAREGREAEERAAARRQLHLLADQVRGLYGAERRVPNAVIESCREFWRERTRIVARFGSAIDPGVREDIFDIAIFWANLQSTIAAAGPPAERALTILNEAEQLLGSSPVLTAEKALASHETMPSDFESQTSLTVWNHYALARAYLRAGELGRAAAESSEAVRFEPHGLWSNFYFGLCAYRQGRFAEAAAAFSVCLGITPDFAGCAYNRALAFTALGLPGRAIADLHEALRIEPRLAIAAFERGRLHFAARRWRLAASDFWRALSGGFGGR